MKIPENSLDAYAPVFRYKKMPNDNFETLTARAGFSPKLLSGALNNFMRLALTNLSHRRGRPLYKNQA
jgi:hypothetical protein